MNTKNYNKLRYEQLPWTEKYRPSHVSDLFLDQQLKQRIAYYADNKWIPNLILDGSSGVGKTTSTKCLARALYGEYVTSGILEMNASDGGVKLMHEEITNFCKNKIIYKKGDEKKYATFKLVIIESGDNMDENKVQPQINNIMELYKETVKFVFTCNTSTNLIEPIQSRCLILQFGKLNDELTAEKLRCICIAEKIKHDNLSLKYVAELSRGDIRSAINILQLVYNKRGELKIEFIGNLCDLPQQVTIKYLFDALIKKDLHSAFSIMAELKHRGYSGSDIVLGMISTLKAEICKDYQEKIKLTMLKFICDASYRISKGTDSILQLYSCLTDIVSV
jgi:replication factor C subunit 2/4